MKTLRRMWNRIAGSFTGRNRDAELPHGGTAARVVKYRVFRLQGRYWVLFRAKVWLR